jgi:hypothetical protein
MEEVVEEEESKFGVFGSANESSKSELEYVYNTYHKYSDHLPRKATKPGPPPKADILPMHSRIYALIHFDAPVV